MISKIAHLADIHIKKSVDRHHEYREVFNRLYTDLSQENPDRIVVVGDIYDNFIDLEGEALILVADFLNSLSNISKVIVTVGNHDIRKKHKSRVNTIKTVTTLIKNDNVVYYEKSGFYKDDNIVWVVWDHVDGINPWKEIKTRKLKTKTYIDLYHDPINGCKLYNGMTMSGKYPTISDFRGDYSFFGDIHLRQFFKGKTKAYPSSLIQQNFGELPENHGYLLWDISNGKVIEKNIHNDYKYINVSIGPDTDYDSIKVNIDKNDKVKVKVKWQDYSANMNSDNERKIRKLIKESVGSELITIESNPLYTDITDSKLLSDIIDINDTTVQKNILIEFLKLNKIDDKYIDKIVLIDSKINSRLNVSESSNIKWDIDKIWFNNFKSYGDNNIIDWSDKDGIIQINGANQQGKSSILDAICYVLYGTTLSTTRREKHGDNRFININRNKNYCDGGVVVDINGEKFTIYRRTERKLKRNGDISHCSTVLDYYKGTDMTDDNKMVGENRVSTQKKLDSVLGTFNDFIRLTLTNADNINDLLSMDRSVFIDNIIRDTGYDIFEKKLSEFKDYKKSLLLDRINVDVDVLENELSDLIDKSEQIKTDIHELSVRKKELQNKLSIIKKDKELLISNLNKIDDSLLDIDPNEIVEDIDDVKDKINTNKDKIKDISLKIEKLPKEFDSSYLITKREEYEGISNTVNESRILISNLNRKVSEIDMDISNIDVDIKNEYDRIKRSIEKDISSKSHDIEIVEKDISIIKRDGRNIKKEIDSLEGKDGDVKVCPTCLRPLDGSGNDHIENEILIRNQKLRDLMIEGKKKMDYVEKIKVEIDNIKNVDIINSTEYKEFVDNHKEKRTSLISKKNDIMHDIENAEKNIDTYTDKLNSIKQDISVLEDKRNKHNTRILLESELKDIKILLKDYESDMLKLNNKYEEFKNNEEYIKQNSEINKKIDEINLNISDMESNISDIVDETTKLNESMLLNSVHIDDINKKIKKFKEQEERDFIFDTYARSMHRDGLPTYLLKKSIHIINNELNKLLTNVDFSLIFDDSLNLKMKSKLNDKVMNAVEGSGMERTFNACALKLALRKVNNTSKPNIILFDEIMNKLVGKSVDNFVELVYEIKNHIDKVIIIEHIHQLKYDYLIDVTKDSSGISSFSVY